VGAAAQVSPHVVTQRYHIHAAAASNPQRRKTATHRQGECGLKRAARSGHLDLAPGLHDAVAVVEWRHPVGRYVGARPILDVPGWACGTCVVLVGCDFAAGPSASAAVQHSEQRARKPLSSSAKCGCCTTHQWKRGIPVICYRKFSTEGAALVCYRASTARDPDHLLKGGASGVVCLFVALLRVVHLLMHNQFIQSG